MKILKRLGRMARALHHDEQGADMVEYILIVAAVVLPLVGVVIWYRNDIAAWISDSYEDVRDGSGSQTP